MLPVRIPLLFALTNDSNSGISMMVVTTITAYDYAVFMANEAHSTLMRQLQRFRCIYLPVPLCHNSSSSRFCYRQKQSPITRLKPEGKNRDE